MHTLVLREELAAPIPGCREASTDGSSRQASGYERLNFTAALPVSLPWLVADGRGDAGCSWAATRFPYGVAKNRKTLETLAGYTFGQGSWRPAGSRSRRCSGSRRWRSSRLS